MEKKFDTFYGEITLIERWDVDSSCPFYEMYDKDGGYYGELWCSKDDLCVDVIEKQIDENMNY